MDVRLIPEKIKQRLNKQSSFDYDNIHCYQFVEAFNKAQLQRVRNMLKGNNQDGEKSETTIDNIDDLQPIVVPGIELKGSNKDIYFETVEIPSNYMRFLRLSVNGSTQRCKGKSIRVVDIVENANVGEFLRDYTRKPSFEWGETFATIQSNRLRIYTNGEFKISDATLTYYRYPTPIGLSGCEDINGNPTTNVDPDFKDDFVENLIDEAAAIIAGDIESINQYQRLAAQVEKNA